MFTFLLKWGKLDEKLLFEKETQLRTRYIEIILFGKVPTFHANILIADIHTGELEKIHTPIEMILLPRGCEHFRAQVNVIYQ